MSEWSKCSDTCAPTTARDSLFLDSPHAPKNSAAVVDCLFACAIGDSFCVPLHLVTHLLAYQALPVGVRRGRRVACEGPALPTADTGFSHTGTQPLA